MEKIHLTPTGQARKCSARPGNCKYGKNGTDPIHYESKDEAKKAYEERMSASTFNNSNVLRKTNVLDLLPKNHDEIPDFVLANLDKFPKTPASGKFGIIPPVATEKELTYELYNSLHDASNYKPKELLNMRNITFFDVQDAERADKYYITVKVPGGSEVIYSTDLVRKELNFSQRHITDSDKTARRVLDIELANLDSKYQGILEADVYTEWQAKRRKITQAIKQLP